ncbi:MAG: hypothetical protein WBX23_12100 [Candidatus Cybelea sp.]
MAKMWHLDFPDRDPDSNYSEPTANQLLYAEQAHLKLEALKSTLERLTIPQQRAILGTIKNELVGGVFRHQPLRLHPDQIATMAEARRK